MSNLSEAIEVSKGTMTCMLNKLVEDGYVERSSSSKDRRNVYVSLTELGNKKVNQIKSKLLEAIDEKLNELEENKKEDIYKALEVLINTFQEKK
jgi:DNA-binding MarR family transcriptional regulator